jgi:hypothetical protein
MVDRLHELGEAELACLTDEELESIRADEDTPFRPASPPERLRSLPDDVRKAVLTTALRGLIARRLIRSPSEEQLARAPSDGRLDLEALGDLNLILKVRRTPVSVIFVGQASYLAALHEFLDPEERTAFLEERIDHEGFHQFTLRSPDGAVEALASVADPDGRASVEGAAVGEPSHEIPDDVSKALRELAPGVTRIEAFHNRSEGTRKVQVSALARPDGVSVVSAAFGVAPEPPRLFRVGRQGLRRFLRAALLDEAWTDPREQAVVATPATPTGYRCPVCGWPGLHEPARTPESGGSYEICPSCGFQFGVSDDDRGRTYEDWRKEWIEFGMPWHSRGIRRPWDWDPKAQLRALEEDQHRSGKP